MTIYFEHLSFKMILTIFFKELKVSKKDKNERNIYYYIDIFYAGKVFLRFINKFFSLDINQLDFELRHIKDDRGELIRLRIKRVDLFLIQSNILKSKFFKSLYNEGWNQDRFFSYLEKGIIPVDRDHPHSVYKIVYIIQVIAWHMKKLGISKTILYLNDRAWFDIYAKYALDNGIMLRRLKTNKIKNYRKSNFQLKLLKYPRLYTYIKNVSTIKLRVKKIDTVIPKLYLECRGDVNLQNNGYHSDFYWYLNSNFPAKNILFEAHSKDEELTLNEHGINIVNKNPVNFIQSLSKIPYPLNNRMYKNEVKILKTIVNSYNFTKAYWTTFFQLYNVKIFQTWYKYDNSHMAIADAIKLLGGISVVNQIAFDGFIAFECYTSVDVVFSFSNWSSELEKELGSKIPYNIITGYPKDNAGGLLKIEAQKLRKRLQSNGAEKIVFSIDENSADDARWHTGHPLQRENYSFILEKVLETPWLGVVFKPKASQTLRQRLGEVAKLLTEAENTGRCVVYESPGRHTNTVPPLLAGLSADVCIHGHLSSGTAAMECALEGLPTLLIDREGLPDSKLYELPKGKVIFENWPDAIDAVMEYFQAQNAIPSFGDWSSILDELDPFRDGKSANRVGTYLHWLIQGFEEGLDRETILADAAQQYVDQWGADKVISI